MHLWDLLKAISSTERLYSSARANPVEVFVLPIQAIRIMLNGPPISIKATVYDESTRSLRLLGKIKAHIENCKG